MEEWNLEVNINLRDFTEKIERDEQHLGLFLHGVRESELSETRHAGDDSLKS